MGRRLAASWVLVAGLLGAGAACAQERDDHYTGLALTYYFGQSEAGTASADLSLGAMEHSVDIEQTVSVTQLPVLQVPLVRQGQPVLAPVAAIVSVVKTLTHLQLRKPGSATSADACHDCARYSLPDLGAP